MPRFFFFCPSRRKERAAPTLANVARSASMVRAKKKARIEFCPEVPDRSRGAPRQIPKCSSSNEPRFAFFVFHLQPAAARVRASGRSKGLCHHSDVYPPPRAPVGALGDEKLYIFCRARMEWRTLPPRRGSPTREPPSPRTPHNYRIPLGGEPLSFAPTPARALRGSAALAAQFFADRGG